MGGVKRSRVAAEPRASARTWSEAAHGTLLATPKGMRYLVAIAVLLYLLCGGPMAGRRQRAATRERVAGTVERSTAGAAQTRQGTALGLR